MHNTHKERKLDVALGLTILGSSYPHELDDDTNMCKCCFKIIPSNHGICMSKVPHYSTDIYETSKLFSKLVEGCTMVAINCDSEDKQHWSIKFNDQLVLGSSLVEAMWRATAKYYNMDTTIEEIMGA